MVIDLTSIDTGDGLNIITYARIEDPLTLYIQKTLYKTQNTRNIPNFIWLALAITLIIIICYE